MPVYKAAAEPSRRGRAMKRTHGAAFQKDALAAWLPKVCEDLVFSFLSIRDLSRTVAPASRRFKALAYEGRHWRKIKMLGVENYKAQHILRLHGRKMTSLAAHGMRISRAMCRLFSKCSMLRSLDLTGIWKSSAVDRRFVACIAKLPLKELRFGQNEICDEGFDLLCASMVSLEELDFNSRIVSARSLYNVCMLKNLKSLCLRSCKLANKDTLRSVCRLQSLVSLQLSFLPLLHCDSLSLLYENKTFSERIETLVLNGMFLNRQAVQLLSRLRNLRVLSLCHPKVNSYALSLLELPKLKLFTVFCANELYDFDWLRKLPLLEQLCLYRCVCSNQSLYKWAKARKGLVFRLYHTRPLRINGVAQHPEEKVDYSSYNNIVRLRLMRRPYPMLV